MVKSKKEKVKTKSKKIEDVEYDIRRQIKAIEKTDGLNITEHSITTLLRDGKRLVPFTRVSGQFDDSLYDRDYYLIGSSPIMPVAFRLSEMYKMLSTNSKTLDGVVLFDAVNKNVREIYTQELKEGLEKEEVRRKDAGK